MAASPSPALTPSPCAKPPSTIPWAIPFVFYNKVSGELVHRLDRRRQCGGFGLGGYKSTALPEDRIAGPIILAFTTAAQVTIVNLVWVDNNPSSPFFGRMYVSWNDFNTCNANILSLPSPVITARPGTARSW